MIVWARAGLAVLGLSLVAVWPAMAQPVTTVYSRIDDTCSERALPDDPVVEIRCGAPGSWQIILYASDHGASVTYQSGRGLSSQPLSPPSRALFGAFHTVIEWREIVGQPFATIHRYYHDTPSEMTGGETQAYQTLMVTALRPETAETACVVAFVDASSLGDANAVARDVADRLSRGWDCALDPIWVDADLPSVDAYIARMGHH